MSKPALKCENNACFKQIYTLKLFIAYKMAYTCCFSLGENLDFPQFLQKSLTVQLLIEIANIFNFKMSAKRAIRNTES